MSSRIPDTHAEAWALLPWLANGRLADEEREWVEAHVQSCAECRAELDGQRQVVAQMNRTEGSPPPVPSEEQRSFNKLWARIEAAESAAPAATATPGSTVPVTRSARTVRWLAAAVVVQALGLGVLGMALNGSTRGDGADISTVTSPEPRLDAPAVTLVFAPQASMATVNTMLAHQGLSIVSGPGLQGNYKAELSPDAVASGATAESVASVISKDPNVILAQPIAR